MSKLTNEKWVNEMYQLWVSGYDEKYISFRKKYPVFWQFIEIKLKEEEKDGEQPKDI